MNEEIMNRLESDYNLIQSMGYEILGVFLQGSQNYQLNDENSDIDTVAIVIPSFKDFLHGCKPTGFIHILPSSEHIEVKDICLMHKCFEKQNPHFLEILFTEYRYMNPDYAEMYDIMFKKSKEIARYNDFAAIHSINGMIHTRFKALEHVTPTTAEKIKQYGYNPKQLHHLLRSYEFLLRYINGTSFRECLIPTDRTGLLNVKRNPFYSLSEMRRISESVVQNADTQVRKYVKKRHRPNIDRSVKKIMDETMEKVLQKHFMTEFCNNPL